MWLGPSTLCHYFLLTELCLKWTILHGDSTVVCLNHSEYIFTSKGNKIQICVLSEYSRYSWITLNLPYRRANLHGENAVHTYMQKRITLPWHRSSSFLLFFISGFSCIVSCCCFLLFSLLFFWGGGEWGCLVAVFCSFFLCLLCVLYLPFFSSF